MIASILLDFWKIVCALAACVTLPGSAELFTLSAAALLPTRRESTPRADHPFRLAVVVPAHNEEVTITSCVQSLLAAERGDLQVAVYVVADNCTDHTAALAKAAGAIVMERAHETERGKGYALHFAFTQLEAIGYDGVLIVDADTSVAPNFLTAAAEAMQAGAAAVQARYLARNAEDSSRTRLMALALRAFNVVRPRGRNNLGLSAGIFGNGFGLRRETLAAVPYLAASVVEDLEYHLSLVRSGRRVVFLEQTTVFGEMPVGGQGVKTQRSRWEGGRLRMLMQQGPALLGDVIRGRWRCLEPLFELLLLPLAFHMLLLLVALCSPQPFVRGLAIAGIAIVLFHLVVTMIVGKGGWRDLAALVSAPFYILWKLLLIPSLLRSASSKHAWVRTRRNKEGHSDSV
jgi:cellulose synthase/poly-beta-1,6-N-acetylglucosamine synthase-like glycosyltransferase